MRKLNIIVVFNKKMDRVLFCIRAKEPYKGMYNFVGGKVEEGESNDDAAYRELFEETGISHDDIELDHFMDLNYFKYENNLFSLLVEFFRYLIYNSSISLKKGDF